MQPRPMAETVGPRRPSCRRWMVMRAILECGASLGKAAIAAHAMAHARRLSHVDRRGRARMVDVSPKPVTRREAVARGGLTLYDMCKAVDREMTLGAIRLVRKTGGRSGTFVRRGERA